MLCFEPSGASARRLARLQVELEHLSVERDRLVEQERGILGHLDSLAAEARWLDARREQLRLLIREQTEAVDELDRRTRQQEEELSTSRERFREVVRLLQRVGPLGRLRPVLDAPDAERLASGLRLTHELTRRKQESVTRIRQQITTLERLRAERRSREEELSRLLERAVVARRRLDSAMRSRKSLLHRVRVEKTTRQRALAELARARDELAEIVAGRSDDHEVALDVRRFRGLLEMPLEGELSLAYGDRRDRRFGTVIPHPGWDVEATFGRTVHAPFEGKVVFADWFRGYGLVVVLDHGHGIHTVYAHLSAILVELGDRVSQGSSLGRVGDTGSLRGPYLYMEVRENGKAVDPADWIRRR